MKGLFLTPRVYEKIKCLNFGQWVEVTPTLWIRMERDAVQYEITRGLFKLTGYTSVSTSFILANPGEFERYVEVKNGLTEKI